jgi:hypothetical protein
MASEPAEIRFKRKIGFDYETGCWPWMGCIGNRGYGVISHISTHRLSWELHRGPIPNGKHVLHSCDNKRCVNPSHLFIGSQADNMKDMTLKGRHGRRKLTDDQVREIYSSPLTQMELSRRFGVAQTKISDIKLKKNYKHVLGV